MITLCSRSIQAMLIIMENNFFFYNLRYYVKISDDKPLAMVYVNPFVRQNDQTLKILFQITQSLFNKQHILEAFM